MYNLKINNWNAGIFWLGATVALASIFIYAYSVYSAIDLSYRIEKELQALKAENSLYQQAEEKYIVKLEGLQDAGRETLGLVSPENETFADRFSSVARAGL